MFLILHLWEDIVYILQSRDPEREDIVYILQSKDPERKVRWLSRCHSNLTSHVFRLITTSVLSSNFATTVSPLSEQITPLILQPVKDRCEYELLTPCTCGARQWTVIFRLDLVFTSNGGPCALRHILSFITSLSHFARSLIYKTNSLVVLSTTCTYQVWVETGVLPRTTWLTLPPDHRWTRRHYGERRIDHLQH